MKRVKMSERKNVLSSERHIRLALLRLRCQAGTFRKLLLFNLERCYQDLTTFSSL